MNKQNSVQNTQDAALKSSDGVAQSPGAMLRTAREAAGIHIEGLAASLKISVKKLESLESDDFNYFPDTVFVRSLAASVCRVLKIDSVPILALMPQENKYRLPENQKGINTAFRGNFGGHSTFWRGASYFKNPSAIAVMVLLMGAIALVFLPSFPEEPLNSTDDEARPSLIQPVASQEAPHSVVTVPMPALVAASSTKMLAATTTATTAATATTTTAATAAALVAVSVPVISASSTASAAGVPAGILVFKARSSSWVKVRDSAGATILQRTLAAGESASVPSSGNFPWSVIVGRANVTDVYIRGDLLNVPSTSRENVARFEVK